MENTRKYTALAVFSWRLAGCTYRSAKVAPQNPETIISFRILDNGVVKLWCIRMAVYTKRRCHITFIDWGNNVRANNALKSFAALIRTFGTARSFVHGFAIVQKKPLRTKRRLA